MKREWPFSDIVELPQPLVLEHILSGSMDSYMSNSLKCTLTTSSSIVSDTAQILPLGVMTWEA